MKYYEKIIELVQSQIGTKEYPPNTNNVKYNTWYYGHSVKDTSTDKYPWCMCFVQWGCNEIGAPLPYKTASCSALLNWYKKNQPFCIVKTPQKGDIIIFKFGHTGFFVGNYGSNMTTIEGNTSINNSSNGGEVMRRFDRNLNQVEAFIRPKKWGDEYPEVNKMTENEKKLIKALQENVNSQVDYEIGNQVLSDVACKLQLNCFPLTLKIFNVPVIIAKDIIPFAGNGSKLQDWKNVINGSFYSGKFPCSILIQDGIIKQKYSCHANYGKPESVLYKLTDGKVKIARVNSTDSLPKNIIWAVGGVGLLNNYNPVAEGFCKLTKNGKTEDFSDVLQYNNHSMLGYKNGYMYLVYCPSMTAGAVNNIAQKLKLEMAIMLDGGHVAGINGSEDFAKINTKSTEQYYIIQGVS